MWERVKGPVSGEGWLRVRRMGVARCLRRSLGRSVALAASGLLLAGGISGAWAQFSGPAIGVPPQAPTATTITTDPSLLYPEQGDLVIAAGDTMTVKIFGSPEYSPVVTVSTNGDVQLPLIGVVQVSGLTVTRAENLISERLVSAGMYKNPQVTINVTETTSRFATVGGELHAVVPLSGPRTLFEVLAAAGSLPVGSSHVVTILRQGQKEPIVVDLGTDPAKAAKANIEILPRDVVLISRVGVVYVLGAFAKQGAIPLDQNAPLTLMEATSLSGGVGFEGEYKDLRIIRTVGVERKEVQVNIKGVLDGKVPDPVLEANDIVFLPSNALKAAIKSGGIGTVTSVLSLLIISLQNR